KTIMRYGLEIDKSAKVTGLTTTEIQKLRYAADQEHASIQALEKGIMNLNVRLGYAGDEMASYTRYFEALGIAYRNTQGSLRSAYDVFGDLFDVMSKGKLTTEETAAVMQLLGARSAKELIPMLKKGKEWFQKMGDEAEQLGIVLDEDVIRLIKETDDNITKLKGSLRGFTYVLGEMTVPWLNDFATVLTRVTLQIREITEATTLSEKAYRLLSMVFPQFITPIEEARIEFVVKQMEQLKKEGKENTVVYQMLSAELKFLWGEFDRMGEVSIPNLDKKMKDFRDTTDETNKEIKEQIDLWKEWITLDTGRSFGQLNLQFEQSAIDLSGITEKTDEAKDHTQILTAAMSQLGSVMADVFRTGKVEMRDFMKIFGSIAGFLIGGPLGAGIGSFIGGAFGEGGVAVPKKWQPIFAQEGMAVAEKPTVSPGGNVYGEKGWEIFMQGEQFTEFIKSMKPTILIHNYTNRDIIVEEIKGTSESAKFELQRELSDNVLSKTEMLNE
ncbi:phage tail tape measure protein, partial [candidate division WOR-3 bacterium]|nr:phage tail tape measure protein [candidate division WOR-3 bacterium]